MGSENLASIEVSSKISWTIFQVLKKFVTKIISNKVIKLKNPGIFLKYKILWRKKLEFHEINHIFLKICRIYRL